MSAEFPSHLNVFLSTPEMNEFYDTSIESKDGQKHIVAKVIVAVHSNVLHKMFSKEKDKNDFKLPTIPGEVLDDILSWMESGQLLLSWRNVHEVLQTAEFLDVPDVSSLCQEWMIARMNSKNALGIWMFARDNFLQGLEKTSMSFIGSNFTYIYKEKEFSFLKHDILKILLVSNKLSCGEEEVWEGLKVWLCNNDDKDEEDIITILETIRFGLLENNFYSDKVRPVLERFFPSFSCSFSFSFNLNLNTSAEPRFPESLILTFGGWSGSGPVSTISIMDPSSAKWTDLSTSLPCSWAYLDTVVVDTEVFLCGGHVEHEDSRMFMKFNCNTMEITRLSKMKEYRNYVSLATHKGNIYAMGGKNQVNQRLNSVEMYNINRNQWYKIRPMHMFRSDAGAATLNGNIYVVGGFDGNTPTNSVEVLSPISGKWSLINHMKVARSGVKVVAMDSKLYVVGGWDGSRRLRSGEVYDPETEKWTDLPDMNIPRSNHSLAVVQGKLVVIGGYTGNDTTSKVEQLNLLTNTWEKVEDLPCKRSALSSCVITFNKLKEEVRNTLRLEKSEIASDDVDIFMDEDEDDLEISDELSSDMSFDESGDEMME